MTAPEASWQVFIPFEIDLSAGHAAAPVSMAPDIWYGATPNLTVGLVHSSYGRTGFFGQSGDGICFTGEDDGCDGSYRNAGVEARYHLYYANDFSLGANVGLLVVYFEPFS